MQWSDEAIILKIKPFSEKSHIVTVITNEHGIYSGLLKNKNVSLGDFVKATWTARLSDQLGTFSFDIDKSCVAFLLRNKEKLMCFNFFCELLNELMHERMRCSDVYKSSYDFLVSICEESNEWILKYLLLEISLLPRIGFVLDFSDLKNATEDDPLEFVSPKTGKIVRRSVGLPYKDRLLKFPTFFLNDKYEYEKISKKEFLEAFLITNNFIFKGNLKSKENEEMISVHKNLIFNCLLPLLNQ